MTIGDGTPTAPVGVGSVIQEQPDINTIELATYGDTYLDVKSTIYLIDMMLEVAKRDYERVVASCHGEEYRLVREKLRRSPYIVSQERPHVENYEELMAVRKAKKLYRAASTVRTLEQWRVEVEAYGALNGAYQYGQYMTENGISADLMRRIFKKRASKGMTNSYQSIRDMRDGRLMDGLTERERSLARMAEMILMANEYDRAMTEYPEDDSAEEVVERWVEEHTPRPPEPEPEGDVDDETHDIDMGVLRQVPEHIGVDFVDDDPGQTAVEEEVADDVVVDDEPHVGIGPVSSSMEDAVEAVPRQERLRIGPGTPEEQRFFLDSKYGRIERIGPASSSIDDALETVRDVLVTFLPPSHPEDFAKWYGRRLMHDHPDLGEVSAADDGEDGIILIQRNRSDDDPRDGEGVE